MTQRKISPELVKHLEEEHKLSPLSTYLKEIVYGGSDGIVTTFAVVAGFAGAQQNISTLPIMVVLLFGMANLFADGASMGLSNFLSLRSEKDLYHKEWNKELHEIKESKPLEEAETMDILQSRGFSPKDAKQLTTIYAKNEDYWVSFMMNYELELPDPRNENPFYTGFATFISFVFFGFIPLIPYIFMRDLPGLFRISCFFTLFALLLLGVLRWKITKHTLFRSIGEVVLVGSVSAVFAFFVGSLFKIG